MGANSFLVRFAGGWAERKSSSSISTYGRIEALLGLGALSSLAEVNRVADGQLDDFAEPRVQTDIQIDPRYASETPYMGFQVGDTVTVSSVTHRVLGLAVSEDQATGRALYVPTLNDSVVLDPMARIAQALTKMVRGTLGGNSQVAQPVVPSYQARGRAPEPSSGETFTESFDGPDSATFGVDLDWDVSSASFSNVSNQGSIAADGTTRRTHANADVGNTDMYVEVDYVTAGGTGSNLYLCGRVTPTDADPLDDEGIRFLIEWHADTGETTYALFSDADNPSVAAGVIGSPAGHTYRLELSGTDMRGLRDGVEVISGTCTALTGTLGGLEVQNTTGTVVVDNFEVGPL